MPSSKLIILIPFQVHEQEPGTPLSCFRCQLSDEVKGGLSMIYEGKENAEIRCKYPQLKVEESHPNLTFPQRIEAYSKRLILPH